MFLAPICITSTSSTNLSKYAVDINSVTIGRLVSCFAIFNNSNPSSSKPWKLYGDVLGLKAPPLKKFAPDFFTAFAISTTCSSLSTEQGPAIIPRCPPPTFVPFTSTIVGSGWNNLLAFLYGSCTFTIFSTHLNVNNSSGSIYDVSPTKPNTDVAIPSILSTAAPLLSTASTTSFNSSCVNPGFITIIISILLPHPL